MVLERSTSAPYCAHAHKLQLPQLEPSYNLVPRHLALHLLHVLTIKKVPKGLRTA